ncbi:hypothetical protein [Candidatus Palauibacter sp.]|uniref:hypothetical protein n=1 Tax=Candidatus Palauibacter sp. TaxID=3101350 RepID=UPI003B59BD3A
MAGIESVNPDDGQIEDAYYGDWLHYGFTSGANGAPAPRSRLVYVDLVQTDMTRRRAEGRWTSLVEDLRVELGAEARCTVVENGRLEWRRVTLQPPDSPTPRSRPRSTSTSSPTRRDRSRAP